MLNKNSHVDKIKYVEVLIELYDKSNNLSKHFVSKKYRIINNKLINECGKPADCIHSPIMYYDSIYYNTTKFNNDYNTIYKLLRYTDKNGMDYSPDNIINKKVIVIDSLGTYVELKEKPINKENNYLNNYFEIYKNNIILEKNYSYSYSSSVYFSVDAEKMCSDTNLSANDDTHTTTIITIAT